MRTSKTFRSVSSSRGCAEFGPSHLTYTDTVHVSGRVEWSVVGHVDGERVNSRGVRTAEIPAPLDLERVAAARRASGWSEVTS